MTDTSPVPRPLAPDDALPPVEPPSAGFIVQLFVIPAVIARRLHGQVAEWLETHLLRDLGLDARIMPTAGYPVVYGDSDTVNDPTTSRGSGIAAATSEVEPRKPSEGGDTVVHAPPSVWTIAANALVVHPNYVP